MNRLRPALLTMLCLLGASGAGAETDPDSGPRIALVLSGGGARGGAHLGVLKVLEELKVPVHMIVGTSAGSIIGAAYASGLTLPEIEREIRPLNTAMLFRDTQRIDQPIRRKADDTLNYIGPEVGVSKDGLALPKGAVSGVALEAVLRRLTVRQPSDQFDRLAIPFRAVATDLTTAEMVVLDHGNLAIAIRASMALPAVINPVEIDGRLLVDGGIARNLPVDVARAMGADVVIAVNLGTPLLQRDELGSLLSVSDQMTRVLIVRNVQESLKELGPSDVLITPELGTLGTADFDRLIEAADAGERAGWAAAAQLRRYSVSGDAYAALTRDRQVGAPANQRIAAVQVRGTERVNPEAVRSLVQAQPGDSFDAEQTDADIKRVYGSGDFEHVGYLLGDDPGGGRVLTADVTEKSWGPHYLRFGLGMSSDFDGNAYFDLRLMHRRPWLNRLGAEWRNDLQVGHTTRARTEWYQPLSTSHDWFTSASAEGVDEPFEVFVENTRVARFRRQYWAVRGDVGLALDTSGEVRLGLARGRVRMTNDTGEVPVEQLVPGTDTGGVLARVRWDTLDSLRFPRDGVSFDLQYFRSDPALGAADRYNKLSWALDGAASAGAHALHASLSEVRSLDSDLPAYEAVSLGGFLRLSGYNTGQIVGTSSRLARLIYTYRVRGPGLLDGVYGGLSAEAGRVGDAIGGPTGAGTLYGSALFLAADTPVGPIYLGQGFARHGQRATYFYLGLP